VERSSGRSYVVKTMCGTGDLRARMHNEMDIMNQLNHKRLIRLMDAFENSRSMSLITELAGGGDLMDVLVRRSYFTESDIANYIRQVLEGLQYMHSRGIAHLGLTPGDIYFSRADGDDIQIGDFGLARRIFDTKLSSLNYGMPEFVAPETANGQGVGLAADMWSVGVISYLLLSGISPFRGETDSDTLRKVQAGEINFDPDAFKNISADAKDFIANLLLFSADTRLNVTQALDHSWLKRAAAPVADDHHIDTDRLKNYYGRYRDWYANASCRTWYRLRPLAGAFTDPSRMVYPPGIEYTPRCSPEPRRKLSFEGPKNENVPFEYPGYDSTMVSSESQYQYGPDTYLLQLRDVDFPVRLRQYMKVASHRSPSFAVRMSEGNYDIKLPAIHERRRFTDIMDEEIDDERKSRMYQRYSTNEPYQYYQHQPRRLKHELGSRSDGHGEAEALLEIKRDGMAPFLREKPKTVAMILNQAAQFSCMAVGDPQPVIQWYKNDVLIMPGQRVSIEEQENGSSILRIDATCLFDCGVYKVVARNRSGQTVAKARLVMGDTPSAPDSPDGPEISDTEILLRWKVPRSDGNSSVLCYSLQQKFADATDWIELADNVDHEFFLVRNLTPRTEYQFRLAARNKFGWSDRSIPTKRIMTKSAGSPKVLITRAMKYLQQLTESGHIVSGAEDAQAPMDYTVETDPSTFEPGSPTEQFTFIAEIARGRFSLVAKCAHKVHNKMFAAKIVTKDDSSAQELAVLRTLCHERIVALHQIYACDDLYVFIMEKLQGMDVLTFLSQRHEYTEQMVASIITQILDGLQYLHWRGIAHLDLQPDNVLLSSSRSLDVKLCDVGSAQRVSKLGTLVQCPHSLQAYTAPEILNEEPAFPQSDIWSLGVLTYVLLSGVSPFSGATDDETRLNVTYVRYRFEPLYKEISMEATRFLMLLFKRCPGKRPSAEETLEHRWLQPSEHMLKKRERASFFGNRLKEYTEEYHKQRRLVSTTPEYILSSFGLGLSRSMSNQTDIFTAY